MEVFIFKAYLTEIEDMLAFNSERLIDFLAGSPLGCLQLTEAINDGQQLNRVVINFRELAHQS